MDREKAKHIAEHTLTFLEKPSYSVNGSYFNLKGSVDYCKLNSVTVGKREHIDTSKFVKTPNTTLEITNESVLEASYRLRDERPCVLNFANATEPGGGFKRGSLAQEESIARSSALYPSIKNSWYYQSHKEKKTDFYYTNTIIYSPYVPVFKNDDGDMIEPYEASFITAAAPMRKSIEALYDPDPDELDDELEEIIGSRIDRILKIAALFKYKTIVLGAWGCGAFGNDPYMVADLFKDKLKENPYFSHILFPIYGSDGNYEIFKDVLKDSLKE